MFCIRLLLLGSLFLGSGINAGKPRNPAARRFKDLSAQSTLISRYACAEFITIYYPLNLRLKGTWLKNNPIFNPKWTKKEQLTKLNEWATTLIPGETRRNIQNAIHSALEKLDKEKEAQTHTKSIISFACESADLDNETNTIPSDMSFDSWGDAKSAYELPEAMNPLSENKNSSPKRDDTPKCWEDVA